MNETANEQHMDAEFEQLATLKNLTIKNLNSVSIKEMLQILEPYVLAMVPEGTVSDDQLQQRKRLDYLLGRMANLHAYLRYLWAFASSERKRLKIIGSDAADDMLVKKEALYELANAVKLKYESVSRMVTINLKVDEETPDRVDYEGRRAAQTPKSSKWPT